MKRTLLAVAFVLGTLATFGQTTQKLELDGFNIPIYLKFRNNYTQVRMFAAGQEATPYLDITSFDSEDDCLIFYIEDTNGSEIIFVRCESGSVALQSSQSTYSGYVSEVTHH